ncbi:50S ribosomal protein L13 [Patescibacteria group bacterium]
MKTFSTTPKDIKRDWHLVDAKDQILGRLATKVSKLLIGKNKLYFTPHLDCGDYIVLINSDNVQVTGRKAQQKTYYRHSNFPGGLKSITFEEQLKKDSRKIIENAVKKMLPQNKLRDPRLRRLKIFKNDQHIYQDKFKKDKK